MVSRINSSNLTKTQKLYAVESIKSAILNSKDEEKSRKVEKVLDDLVDLQTNEDDDSRSGEASEADDSLLFKSVYNPTASHDFFDLLFTPGDENIGDIRLNLQNHILQLSADSSSSLYGMPVKGDNVLREEYYEMSNYYFVSTEGLYINQYI